MRLLIVLTLVMPFLVACGTDGKVTHSAPQQQSAEPPPVGLEEPKPEICVFNGVQWINAEGNACTPANGNDTCPASGQYVLMNGQKASCTPDQLLADGFANPDSPSNETIEKCDSFYYEYGIPFYPVNVYGQYICVRYDLLFQQQSYQYYPGGHYYDHYYKHPARTGTDCNMSVDFGDDWGYIGICLD